MRRGAAQGELDLVKKFIADHHGTTHFGRVCMKPGKPTTFATFNVSGVEFAENPSGKSSNFEIPNLLKIKAITTPRFGSTPLEGRAATVAP